jgi:two-component system, cell cycle sensor histidine kinase and response regulator CckA
MNVLYVGDSPADADLLRAELSRHDPTSTVERAPTLAEARQRLTDKAPLDLVLADLGLADGNALELLHEIRESRLPVAFVALTSTGDEEAAQAAALAGADDSVAVSESYRTLLPATLEAALGRFRARTDPLQETTLAALQRFRQIADYDEALRQSEEKFSKAFASSPDAIILTRIRDGHIVEVNEGFMRLSGYSREEALGRTTVELGVWVDLRDQEKYLTALRVEGSVHELAALLRSKLGSVRDGLVSGGIIRLGEDLVAISTIRDVTDAKRAEQELREATQRQSDILDSVGAILWRADAVTFRFLYVSEEAERLLGYPGHRWLDEPDFWKEHIHPDDREGSVAFCAEQTQRLAPHSFEYRMLAADGRTVWLKDLVRVIAEGGRPKELVGVMVDVTALKASAQALHESEARGRESEGRYRSLFEAAPDGILVADATGTYVDANPTVLAMLGYSRDELIGMTSPDILDSRESSRVSGALAEINQGAEHRHEWQFRRKDGSGFHADVVATVMADGRILAVIRDASDRRRMEEQLRQSQKMEAVGRLAGGIAHDFNNLLGVIIGYAEMLRSKTPADHPDRRRIDPIVRAAERGAGLTRQLLAFSRKQVLEPKVLEPSAVVIEMRRLLEPLIGEHIELVLQAGAKGRVKVDPGQLEQVVMNLVVNARDAMPGGGRLRIETADVDLDQAYVQGRAVAIQPGRYVTIAVADTGMGMDEARAFEPFFTTKPEGQGTGLGLATVYGIVKQSEGFVWLYSEVGKGTVFRVYLPRVEEAVTNEPARPETLRRSSTETVLVVEDEPAARELVAELLRAEGYVVLLAEDGLQAVEMATHAHAPIDLLLTDVVLPKLGGRAAAERIQAIHPGIKVLYMSGYTDDEVSRQGVLEPGLVLLQKPFTPDDLTRRVGEVLD